MRVRAAHDRRVRHVLELDVVEVAALAAQEPRVLDAVDALAEPFARGVFLRRVGGDLRGGGMLFQRHAFAATDWMASTICW